eukprot:359138-Pelagomonas_calceolata.AAC.1
MPRDARTLLLLVSISARPATPSPPKPPPRRQKQIAKVPNIPAVDIAALVPFQSNPTLQLKVADWKSGAYTDGSCQVQDGKTVMGAGVYHSMSDSKNLVEPNGTGITNTIGRAELAAIADALTHSRTHTHTRCHRQPQLTSPIQKMNPVSREALASCARRSFEEDFKPCPSLSRSQFFLQGQISH